jgi:hypothetical protein
MQKPRRWPLGWTSSTYVCPHEWKHVSVGPGLVGEIQASPETEIYKRQVYHIIFREGWKYWVTGAFINRKRIDSSQEAQCASLIGSAIEY